MDVETSRNIKATVAHKHEDFINQFQQNRTKIVKDKLKQIETLEKSIEKYEQRKKDNDRLTATEHILLFQMQKEVKAIREELRKINNKEAEHQYFLKTSHVITEYDKTHQSDNNSKSNNSNQVNSNQTNSISVNSNQTNSNQVNSNQVNSNQVNSNQVNSNQVNSNQVNSNQTNSNQKTKKQTKPNVSVSKNSILSFMKAQQSVGLTPVGSTLVGSTPIIPNQSIKDGENKITAFFNRTEGSTNRAQLQDIYMQQIDENYISKEKYKTCTENIFKCPNPDCGAVDDIIYNFNLGRRNCNICGIQIDFFFDPSFNSYKATASIELTPEFPYRRENHVSEWLAKIQGKENTEIPESVFAALENEFKKNRIKDYKTLNPDFVKKCLKELKLNKYYDHKEYIIHRFNGLPPPQLSIELEDTLKRMFMQIQDPFEKYCPTSRKNFLSYSYVFHKFCQLLELDDLLIYFPLLKSREKLFEQDKIWKQICKDLRWQYIPSL